MRRNRALDRWTPDEEEREFHALVGEHYVANCLDKRTDADRAALKAGIDSMVTSYFRRDPEGATAVDIGAGEGWATQRLRELGFDAVGVERSPVVAARAPEGSVLVGNAESLPLDDASIDFAVCNSIFEHVLNPENVIAEVARVLRPGGVCVLSTTNKWHPRTGEIEILFFPWMPYRLRERLWYRSGRRHISPHYFTFADLRKMAERHGLRYESVITAKLRDDPVGSWKGRLARRIQHWPGASFLMEAIIPVVKVKLTKPE